MPVLLLLFVYLYLLLNMNYLDTIINQILNNFDFAYMLIVNVLCFILIKIHDYLNGDGRKVATWNKRLYLVISIIVIGAVYQQAGEIKTTVLVNSAILAPVFWSWIAAPILHKFGITYKQADDALK